MKNRKHPYFKSSCKTNNIFTIDKNRNWNLMNNLWIILHLFIFGTSLYTHWSISFRQNILTILETLVLIAIEFFGVPFLIYLCQTMYADYSVFRLNKIKAANAPYDVQKNIYFVVEAIEKRFVFLTPRMLRLCRCYQKVLLKRNKMNDHQQVLFNSATKKIADVFEKIESQAEICNNADISIRNYIGNICYTNKELRTKENKRSPFDTASTFFTHEKKIDSPACYRTMVNNILLIAKSIPQLDIRWLVLFYIRMIERSKLYLTCEFDNFITDYDIAGTYLTSKRIRIEDMIDLNCYRQLSVFVRKCILSAIFQCYSDSNKNSFIRDMKLNMDINLINKL